MLKILPYFRILYLEQESSILRCFSRLTFSRFFSFISRSKMIVRTAEKDQIKYFAQNKLGKITFLYAQTAEMYYTMNDHHIR